MGIRYLVPCTCGETLEVEPSQAGLSVTCACGASTEMPTLMGLRQYPRADGQAAPSKTSTWGPRQGLMALGVILMVSSGVLMLQSYRGGPVEPRFESMDYEAVRSQASRMTLEQARHEWNELPRELDGEPHPYWSQYARATRNFRLWMISVGAVTVVGLILVVASRFIRASA